MVQHMRLPKFWLGPEAGRSTFFPYHGGSGFLRWNADIPLTLLHNIAVALVTSVDNSVATHCDNLWTQPVPPSKVMFSTLHKEGIRGGDLCSNGGSCSSYSSAF
jgi:hypothetical protein